METHAAQDVQMVLMNIGGYELTEGGECAFVVGQKDCLNESGYINSTDTSVGGWDACERRAWCNGDYRNAFPNAIKPIFKQFKAITASGGQSSQPVNSNDFFSLLAEKEVFGKNITGTQQAAENELFQIEYYNVEANRIKNKNGLASNWWLRSPDATNTFFGVYTNGHINPFYASELNGIAPFGCI